MWEDDTNPIHRESIEEGELFTLSFKPNTSPKDIEAIKETLVIFGLFGGLGGRSRRGFGSVCLTELVDANKKTEHFNYSLPEYRQQASQIIAKYRDIKEVPYTAFSQYACFEIVKPGKNARQIHGRAGYSYKNYRGNLKTGEKIPFGLPLKDIDENRRASPLLYHIHPLADRSFVVGILYLPATFHHLEQKYRTDNLEQFYRPVTDFLNKEAIK